MSFTMPVSQYFPLVTTMWGPQMALLTAPRALIWPEAIEAAVFLFPHFKGMECRCGYIASFSCSAFLKEKFGFVSVKMMGVLFTPVNMGF